MSLSTDVIDVIRADGPACVCHITPASRLPDIAASGALLSCVRRRETSVRWGGNADLGEDLVCCGFRPHWGVLHRHFRDEESVILLFDAASVAAMPGARLSPRNTATTGARRYMR